MASVKYKALARIFTRRFMSRLLSGEQPKDVNQLESWMQRAGVHSENANTRALLESAYRHLKQGYRCEYVYKNEFVCFEATRHEEADFCAVNEVCIGSSIADIVLFNGITHVIEVKTELDDLNRLACQIEDYRQFSPYVSVFTTESMAGILSKARLWKRLGIYALNDCNEIQVVRNPQADWKAVSHHRLLAMLNKPEVLALAKGKEWDISHVKPTLYKKATLDYFQQLTIEEAEEIVRKTVKARLSATLETCALLNIPHPVRYLALSSPEITKKASLRVFSLIEDEAIRTYGSSGALQSI